MQDALKKKTNPVRILIENELPEYMGWFSKWREQRNRIKEGTSVGIAGPGSNVGVTFLRFDKESDNFVADLSQTVRLNHVIEAILYSRDIAKLATKLAQNLVGHAD